MTQPIVQHCFDEPTNTFSYVVRDPDSQACAILDSVLDFDYAAGRTDVRSADEIIQYVRDNNLTVEWILETHVHADHLSAAPYLHEHLGGKTGIGAKIVDVQEIFGKAFNAICGKSSDPKATLLPGSHSKLPCFPKWITACASKSSRIH